MRSLTSLIKWIGFLVIPLGAVMFIKEYLWLKSPIADAVTSTVGSIVGMIPEGLYLLTSLALVASVIRLANRRTLVHDMGCIETLARVDTLCVDKTGTITEPKMTVDDIVPLQPDRYIADDIRMIMADYVCAMQDDNDTMAALRRYFTGQSMQTPCRSGRRKNTVVCHSTRTRRICSVHRKFCWQTARKRNSICRWRRNGRPRAAGCCCWRCTTESCRMRR